MKLLVLGASDIFARRVLPGLAALGVTGLEVASRSGRRPAVPAHLPVLWHDDPAAALARSPAETVYVSTENSRHAPLALAALESGRHVIVDKPAFLDFPTAERAANLAAQKNLVLAEATVWTEHPRPAAALAAFAAAGSAPTRLSAVFSFPPLPAGNFRHRSDCGGGALFDLGAYAASPGRVFFQAEPEQVSCRILSRGPEVDTAFVCQMLYPGGKSFTGTFGFDTGYVNRLDILGPALAATMDRAFTPPPNAALTLELNAPSGQTSQTTPPTDAFARFFQRVFTAIDTGHGQPLTDALLTDARTLARLRQAAVGE
ncbi:Gfo/Idh/MocA family protein [Solidesulfovibrio sp.]